MATRSYGDLHTPIAEKAIKFKHFFYLFPHFLNQENGYFGNTVRRRVWVETTQHRIIRSKRLCLPVCERINPQLNLMFTWFTIGGYRQRIVRLRIKNPSECTLSVLCTMISPNSWASQVQFDASFTIASASLALCLLYTWAIPELFLGTCRR